MRVPIRTQPTSFTIEKNGRYFYKTHLATPTSTQMAKKKKKPRRGRCRAVIRGTGSCWYVAGRSCGWGLSWHSWPSATGPSENEEYTVATTVIKLCPVQLWSYENQVLSCAIVKWLLAVIADPLFCLSWIYVWTICVSGTVTPMLLLPY